MCSLWEINRGKKRLKSFLITCREKRSSSAECNVFEDGAIYKWKESVFFIRTASCGPVWDTASPGSNSWQGESVQLLISLISTLNHRGAANQWNHLCGDWFVCNRADSQLSTGFTKWDLFRKTLRGPALLTSKLICTKLGQAFIYCPKILQWHIFLRFVKQVQMCCFSLRGFTSIMGARWLVACLMHSPPSILSIQKKEKEISWPNKHKIKSSLQAGKITMFADVSWGKLNSLLIVKDLTSSTN